MLVEAVRRRLDREMRDAFAGELRRACGAARPDRAWSASRRSRRCGDTTPMVPMLAAAMAERRPDLPREGRDRGLAAGAGDGGDGLRAGAERICAAASASARRALPTRTNATPAGSGVAARARPTTATAPAATRLRDEAQAVGLGCRHRDEHVARLDRAAVGGDAARRRARRSAHRARRRQCRMSASFIAPSMRQESRRAI